MALMLAGERRALGLADAPAAVRARVLGDVAGRDPVERRDRPRSPATARVRPASVVRAQQRDRRRHAAGRSSDATMVSGLFSTDEAREPQRVELELRAVGIDDVALAEFEIDDEQVGLLRR